MSQMQQTAPPRTVPFARPLIGDRERQAVLDVLDGHTLVHGPHATEFEERFAEFTGAPHAVSVSSCTAGMHLVWFALGLGPGDEVIVPAQTHTATAHAVEVTGARAVFVDSQPATGNVDAAAVREAITSRTRAIAVVHYLGEPVDMAPILQLARERDIFVLEDCALAVGTRVDGVHAGLLGDVGCFSFYPVKHMTTAEGGMVITRDEGLAADVRAARAFGVDRSHGERSVPGVYDVTSLGINYRLNEIQAALGTCQIDRLDEFLRRRRKNHEVLAGSLSDIDGLTILPASDGVRQSSYYCLGAVLDAELEGVRLEIVERLRANGVGTSVYYPRPVPLMTYYRDRYGHTKSDFPVASWISNCSIALPVGPHLQEGDAAYVGDQVRAAVAKVVG